MTTPVFCKLPPALSSLLVVVLFCALARPQSGATAAPKTGVPLARERFKNLKVLGDIPQAQWFGTMAFMSGSLGVKCEYCHQGSDFVSDDKPQKQTARRMITMMREVNERFFDGNTFVTCNSCHRGSTRPVKTPDPELQAFWHARSGEAAAAPATQPASAVIASYRRAVFGSESIPVPAIAATVREHTINGSGPAMDRVSHVSVAARDKMRVEIEQPGGAVVYVCNGDQAWVKTPTGTRDIRCSDLLQFTAAVAPDALELTEEMTPIPSEKVGDETANVFASTNAAGRKVWLYFSPSSGLLLRRRQFIETAFGAFPSDDDFRDYASAGRYKLPNTVETKSVASYFIRNISDRRVDIALPDSLFQKP